MKILFKQNNYNIFIVDKMILLYLIGYCSSLFIVLTFFKTTTKQLKFD